MGSGTGSTQNAQQAIASEQVGIAQQQQGLANETYATVAPGLQTAEAYYTSLASGDPTKIASAVGPAVSSIDASTSGAVQSILQSTPRGGAQDLAVAQAQIQKAGQIGNLETQAYTSSFPALASLFSGGANISINQVANALSGFQGASGTEAAVGQEQAQGKASTMGFLGSMAGAAGTAYAG